jgi:hypothetical protein
MMAVVFDRYRPVRLLLAAIGIASAGSMTGVVSAQQRPEPARAPLSAKQSAVIDVTGYWVSIVDEDWRWRMMTAPIGDVSSVPVNAAGRQAAQAWNPKQDQADGSQCKAYGAAGLMRIPERLHVSWADESTLQIDTDAGTQKRLLHFAAGQDTGEASLQGYSSASWYKQLQSKGFGPPFGGPQPGKGGSLKLVTTHMKPGYLRSNGIPYSGEAVLLEYIDRVEDEGASYLILTSVVKDPKYLNDQYVTSYQYRLEPDGSKWNPQPCKISLPTSTALPTNAFGR